MSTILALVLLPFIGAILAFVLGKFKESLAFWSAYGVGAVLFLLTLYTFFTYTEPISLNINWFTFGTISMPFGLYIDHLSLVMLLIATGLGFLDIHFAHDYMAEDMHKPRYYAKVLFFIGGMILLVSAKEMTGAFVGWEFMGLASYLLISFWHQKKEPADAGVSAFLYTRFGDIFLFASIGLLFHITGTLDIQSINTMATNGQISQSTLYVIAIFIFISAIGKSGQFPLFPWLMRAMEGPTTVSALIHGATMVNSGIYIVARLFDFYIASEALVIVASIGALSAFVGATSALVQNEMKKVLAYSTMSHLSLAFIGLGAGSLAVGMSHLTNHAVFKALLFLSAGAIIMSASHTKDMFKLGGLKNKLFLVAIFMGLGALSLSGIPPFSGFYSKDAVLASVILNPDTSALVATLSVISGVLSIAYIARVWVLVFLKEPRDEKIYEKVKTPSKFWISLPLGIMAVITLILGFYQEDLVSYFGAESHHMYHLDGLMPLLFSSMFFLALIIYFFYYRRTDLRIKLASQPLMKAFHEVLLNGYFVEKMITWFSKSIIVGSIAKFINWCDVHLVDGVINSVPKTSQSISDTLGKTQSGKVGAQTTAMLLGVVIILAVMLLKGVL